MAECKTCAKLLSAANKIGYCRAHAAQAMAGPEHAARVSAGLKRKLAQDPIYREQCKARALKNCASETLRTAAKEASKRSGAWRKALAAVTPEDYKRGAARCAETKLAWCPPELRDAYRDLLYRKKLKAAEARELILAQHEKDMAGFRRKLGAE